MDTDVETEFHLSPDGHDEDEDQEQLNAAHKKLSTWVREDGQLITMTKQQFGVIQQILLAATEKYREQQMWRMCDFLDDEEAMDHVAAYYEALELGMDTSFNVAYTFALCSANRKVNRTNLIHQLLESFSHLKYTTNMPGKKDRDGYANPRSPLSS